MATQKQAPDLKNATVLYICFFSDFITVESCKEELKFDLMFVNDESGSIGADNYQKSLNFMVDVMKGYK